MKSLKDIVEAAGWGDDKRITLAKEFGQPDGNFLTVHTPSGIAMLHASEDGTSFNVSSYTARVAWSESALPDDIKASGLHYNDFLRLVDQHDLNRALDLSAE